MQTELRKHCHTAIDALVFRSAEYAMLRKFYGDRQAQRSGVPLINHIREGVTVMGFISAEFSAKLGYVLHPMLQSFEDLMNQHRLVTCDRNISSRSVLYAMEYRRAANAYLCTTKTDGWKLGDIVNATGTLLPQVRDMLIADKVQNFKDFTIHHHGTHARSAQLNAYFNNWFIRLDILHKVPQLLAQIGMYDTPPNLYTAACVDQLELLA